MSRRTICLGSRPLGPRLLAGGLGTGGLGTGGLGTGGLWATPTADLTFPPPKTSLRNISRASERQPLCHLDMTLCWKQSDMVYIVRHVF